MSQIKTTTLCRLYVVVSRYFKNYLKKGDTIEIAFIDWLIISFMVTVKLELLPLSQSQKKITFNNYFEKNKQILTLKSQNSKLKRIK